MGGVSVAFIVGVGSWIYCFAMIDEPKGFLPILNFDSSTNWDDLLGIAKPHLDASGLSRLKKSLFGVVKSIAVEKHYIDRDYRDTFSQYYSKKFITPDSRCIRLHFFNKVLKRSDMKSSEQLQSSYLGYSVMRPTRPNCIGRTLLKPECRINTRGDICECEEKISIQGTELSVKGFPFISQDSDVTVCAQAALWMLSRYFSDRYHLYPEKYPVQISNLTQDYSVGRLFPSSGLYIWQLAEALRRLNFGPLLYSKDLYEEAGSYNHHNDYFQHLIYTYIESGIPVLAAFSDHVVVLFGHNSDYSKLTNGTINICNEFIFSSSLNNEYIGNDDNGIPYQILSHGGSDVDCMSSTISDIEQFVAPLPEKVFLPAESFETLVTRLLKTENFGYRNLSTIVSSDVPVLRLFLTTGKSFKSKLTERGMGSDTVENVYRSIPLPHFIWVCEISSPSIYPEKVLGEVLWDATRNAHELDGWIALHYPETLIVDIGSALNREADYIKYPLSNSTSYPLFISNLRDIS